MSDLAATGALVRLALRRDRVILPVCVAVFVIMVATSASATADLYRTRRHACRPPRPQQDPVSRGAVRPHLRRDSLGAVAMLKMGGIGAIVVAVLALFLVVRHTRAEEETGRLELVGAAVVGRCAPLTAALLVGPAPALSRAPARRSV